MKERKRPCVVITPKRSTGYMLGDETIWIGSEYWILGRPGGWVDGWKLWKKGKSTQDFNFGLGKINKEQAGNELTG